MGPNLSIADALAQMEAKIAHHKARAPPSPAPPPPEDVDTGGARWLSGRAGAAPPGPLDQLCLIGRRGLSAAYQAQKPSQERHREPLILSSERGVATTPYRPMINCVSDRCPCCENAYGPGPLSAPRLSSPSRTRCPCANICRRQTAPSS